MRGVLLFLENAAGESQAWVKVFAGSVCNCSHKGIIHRVEKSCMLAVRYQCIWEGIWPSKIPKGSFFFYFKQLELTYNSLTQVYKTHTLVNAGISDITIRRDKKILATAGWDHRIRIFGWKRLKPLAVLDYHTATVHCVSFSDHKNARERLLAAGSKDHRISIWSIYTQTWHGLRCHGLGKQDWRSDSLCCNSNLDAGNW